MYIYMHHKQQHKIDLSSLTKLPIPQGFTMLGIDVSHHNGDINWEAVKVQGVTFAYIKATEGTILTDKHCSSNYHDAKEAGIKVGMYHFFRFREGGKEQAQYFLDNITYQKGDLPPVIDIEYSCNNICNISKQVVLDRIARLKQFDSLVYCRLLIHPIIYTNKECYEHLIRNHFPDNDLWLCNLSAEPSEEEYPNWVIWQHSHKGTVVGIPAKVDMDVFYADKEEFNTWLE